MNRQPGSRASTRRAGASEPPRTHVEPAVNRQPGFRRELVEQSTTFKNLFLKFPSPGAIEIEESKAVKIS